MSVRSPVGTLSGGLVALTMAEGGLPLGVAWPPAESGGAGHEFTQGRRQRTEQMEKSRLEA